MPWLPFIFFFLSTSLPLFAFWDVGHACVCSGSICWMSFSISFHHIKIVIYRYCIWRLEDNFEEWILSYLVCFFVWVSVLSASRCTLDRLVCVLPVDSLVSASHPASGAPGVQMCATTPGFLWRSHGWIQVVKLHRKLFYPLSHLTDPHLIFFLLFYFFPHLIFWDRVSYWTWSSSVWLHPMASKPQGPLLTLPPQHGNDRTIPARPGYWHGY